MSQVKGVFEVGHLLYLPHADTFDSLNVLQRHQLQPARMVH